MEKFELLNEANGCIRKYSLFTRVMGTKSNTSDEIVYVENLDVRYAMIKSEEGTKVKIDTRTFEATLSLIKGVGKSGVILAKYEIENVTAKKGFKLL